MNWPHDINLLPWQDTEIQVSSSPELLEFPFSRVWNEAQPVYSVPVGQVSPCWNLHPYSSSILCVCVCAADMIFIQGPDVIFKVALMLLGSHRELILQCDSFEGVVDFLKTTLPEMAHVQMERVINQVRHISHARHVKQFSHARQVRQFSWVKQVRHISHARQVRHISHTRQVRHISHARQVGHISQARQVRHMSHPRQVRHISQARQVRHISQARHFTGLRWSKSSIRWDRSVRQTFYRPRMAYLWSDFGCRQARCFNQVRLPRPRMAHRPGEVGLKGLSHQLGEITVLDIWKHMSRVSPVVWKDASQIL